MPHRLHIAILLALALTTGCAGKRTVVKVKVEPCPPVAPKVSCPNLPQRGSTLRELLIAWEEAKATREVCAEALKAWQDSFQGCEAGGK